MPPDLDGPRGAIRRSPGYLAAQVGDEILIMSVERGRYFSLNPWGARIWQLIETPQAMDSVVARLIEEYEVVPELCRREVGVFVAALEERGLVLRDAVTDAGG